MFNIMPHFPRFMQKSVLSAAAILALASPAHANLITNGSFENPRIRPGTDVIVIPVGSTQLSGWSVVGPSNGNVDLADSMYDVADAGGYDLRASHGTQWLDLTGHATNIYQGIAQTVATTNGDYLLTFDVGNVIAPQLYLGISSAIELRINGATVQTFTNVSASNMALNWQSFSCRFHANGAAMISFFNRDLPSDNLNGLDNVALTPVPEPSTYALMLTGMMLLGFAARRRKESRGN